MLSVALTNVMRRIRRLILATVTISSNDFHYHNILRIFTTKVRGLPRPNID